MAFINMLFPGTSELCRICLNDSRSFIHIYGERLGESFLHVIVNDVCQLDVNHDDGLPKFVCCDCYEKILQFDTFKRKAHEGNAALLHMKCYMNNHVLEQRNDGNVYGRVTAVEPEVEITVETENTLEFDSDSSDGDQQFSSRSRGDSSTVNYLPVRLKRSGPIVRKGKRDRENESQEVIQSPKVGTKMEAVRKSGQRKGKRKIENKIPEKEKTQHVKASLKNDKRDRAVLNDNKTGSNTPESTPKLKDGVASKRSAKKKANVVPKVEPIEDCALESESVSCNAKKDDSAVETNKVDDGKKKKNGLKGERIFRSKRQPKRDKLNDGSDVSCKRTNVVPKEDRSSDSKGAKLPEEDISSSITDNNVKEKENNSRSITDANVETEGNDRSIFKCYDCGKEFYNKLDMVYHTKEHYGTEDNCCILEGYDDKVLDRSFKCHICDKMFYRVSNLKLHEMIHTGNKEYMCEFCGKKFLHLGHLKVHERLHSGELPYQCEVCKRGFNNASNFRVHQRVHSGEKPYKCSRCKMAFAHINRLKVHEKCHDTGKKGRAKSKQNVKKEKELLKCKLCDKEFYQRGNLKMHEKWHQRDKVFSCEVCKKEFSKLYRLARHKVVHAKEKPFSCKVCKKQFSYASNLKVHERLHASPQKELYSDTQSE